MKRNVKMKILIAVVFTILILALIAGFFMNRRGDGEVRSAYDGGKAVEEFEKRYNRQIASRLRGSYQRVPFLGDDIRVLKNKVTL